jgi:murein DD-endopeptidase MepM/ murein hydrolase activator NlpD
MTDAVAKKDLLTQAKNRGLLNPKRFDILLSNAQNEPLLTLKLVQELVGSLAQAFRIGSEKAHNPNPSVLKIIAGSEALNDQNIKFDLDGFKQEDASIPDRGQSYIKSTLYPEDVIYIIYYLRQWLYQHYKKEHEGHRWGIDTSTLQRKWRDAASRKTGGESGLANPIADFSQHELRDAIEELLVAIDYILALKTGDTFHDPADDLFEEIRRDFKTKPKETWEKIGAKVATSIAEASINTRLIIIPDKNLDIRDVRKIINVYYEQVIAQYEPGREIKSPWDRISDESKQRFNPQQKEYFTTNEVNEGTTIASDVLQVDIFTQRIEQLFKELAIVPPEPAAAAPETEEEEKDIEGGGDEATSKFEFQTEDEIVRQTIRELSFNSGNDFLEYFATTNTNPYDLSQAQRDWLLVRLPEFIQTLLSQNNNQQHWEGQIKQWIRDNFSAENEIELRYGASDDQIATLQKKINSQFFAYYSTPFIEWIRAVPSETEVETTGPVDAETPPATTVTPPIPTKTEIPTPPGEKVIDRNKFIRDETTRFLGLYFGKDGEEFRELVSRYIDENIPSQLTTDLVILKLKLFRELQLNRELYEATKKFYDQKLSALGLDEAVARTNINNTLDSILILVKDPHEYLANLSEKQLREQFGLEGLKIDIEQFRVLLLGLIFVRRAYYYIERSTPIKPWFDKDQGKQKLDQSPQYISQMRGFIKETGEEGVMALNLDEDGIERSAIDAERKALIKKLYQDLWLNTVAGKDQAELMVIYKEYGVSIIDIDLASRPVPDGFIYSELVQDANNTKPIQARETRPSLAKELLSDVAAPLKEKLADLALIALAPELAPVLASLKEIPIIGKIFKDIEEQGVDAVAKLLPILGLAGAALIGWITRSVGALIGGISGGIIGGLIGSTIGPWGTVLGAGVGSTIGVQIGHAGGLGLKNIGGVFKNLGGGSGAGGSTLSGAAGLGTKLGVGTGLGTGVSTTVMVGSTIGGIAGGTAIMMNMTAGSMLHPVATTLDSVGEQSKYVSLKKTADVGPEVENPPGKITYIITISADNGYAITINSATDKSTVSFKDDGQETETREQSIDDLNNTTITPGESVEVEYSQNFGTSYLDSRITNSFSINFSYQKESDSGTDTASTSYSVGIGDYPMGDGCWPTTGKFTQGPLGIPNLYGVSHSSIQAIDIHNARGTPIFTPFDGEACAYPQNSGWLCAPSAISAFGTQYCYGNHVVLNEGSFTVGFAHMDSFSSEVTPGSCKQISAGTLIGTMGNSGLLNYGPDVGLHLHYELRPSSLDFSSYVPGPMEIHDITQICPNQ